MAAIERIVIDAEPLVKKKLSEIANLTGQTMKEVVCNLIESKHSEMGLDKIEIDEFHKESR
ncbi:hypothetical protein ABEP00_20285 [Heyndrickxia sporothermodurans]|uniref:hypothetical protein n=1 Tax=Heyndrickxia sporothermodurans TaxID=46224 RepID=UPI003D1F7222